MKQTAMQEMIKKLEEKRDMWKADGKLADRQIRGTYVIAILLAKELLELEKQQMIEMHDKGFDSVVQLNDDYAIGFAEWCLTIRFEPIENPSVKKLLEIYKKEKL